MMENVQGMQNLKLCLLAADFRCSEKLKAAQPALPNTRVARLHLRSNVKT
jgi:hypothetical protein